VVVKISAGSLLLFCSREVARQKQDGWKKWLVKDQTMEQKRAKKGCSQYRRVT
jgi:hypothetical protein